MQVNWKKNFYAAVALLAVSTCACGCGGGSGTGGGAQGSMEVPAICGNGTRETGERCDDGNTVDNDGCSSECGMGFFRTYGDGLEESAYSVLANEDGTIMMAGIVYESDALEYMDIRLMKLDPRGDVLESNDYGNSDCGERVDSMISTDEGYILVGNRHNCDAWSADFLVLNIGETGEELWINSYVGGFTSRAYAVVESQGGDTVVAGITINSDQYDFRVLKLDSDGNVLWDNYYGGEENERAYGIDSTPDGGSIVAGVNVSTGIWIMKIGADGDVVWDSMLETEYAGGIGVLSIMAVSDGGYVFVGAQGISGAGAFNYVEKIDSLGAVEWKKSYEVSGDGSVGQIIEASDGGYVAAGYTGLNGNELSDVWVAKVDPDGNTVWERTHGGDGWEVARSIKETPDGGFILAGEACEYFYADCAMMLMKLDSDGECYGCFSE